MVVLAGGMATRFGGGVKAVAEAIDGRSFLEVKLGETARLGEALGVEIPVALMTSFATDEVVRAHVAEKRLGDPLWFCQTAAPRLRPDGSVFVEDDGRRRSTARATATSSRRIRSSGTLAELAAPRRPDDRRLERRQPRRAPRSGRRRDARARGNAADGGGRREGQRHGRRAGAGRRPPAAPRGDALPARVRPGAHPGLQHQHLADRGRRARRAHRADLARRREDRRRSQPAVQFERLYHELSAHVPTTFLVVPRHGPRGRFLPVKEPADLAEVQPLLREMLATPLASEEG